MKEQIMKHLLSSWAWKGSREERVKQYRTTPGNNFIGLFGQTPRTSNHDIKASFMFMGKVKRRVQPDLYTMNE